MIEVSPLIEALQAYRKKLIAAGQPAKAAAVHSDRAQVVEIDNLVMNMKSPPGRHHIDVRSGGLFCVMEVRPASDPRRRSP